ADLRNVLRPVDQFAACRLGLLDGGVDVLDRDVADPVGRRPFLDGRKAAVGLAVDGDHRVLELLTLEDLDLPPEELGVEVLRPLGVGGHVLVPHERADLARSAGAHALLLSCRVRAYHYDACNKQLRTCVYEVETVRSYRQHCGIARALDLVGERWAMLVIRDLILGPKRFTDLRDTLPGIA